MYKFLHFHVGISLHSDGIIYTEHDIPYGDFKEYLYHEKNDIPENYAGCLGYPTRATNKKGEMIWNRMIEKMVNDYKILFK